MGRQTLERHSSTSSGGRLEAHDRGPVAHVRVTVCAIDGVRGRLRHQESMGHSRLDTSQQMPTVLDNTAWRQLPDIF